MASLASSCSSWAFSLCSRVICASRGSAPGRPRGRGGPASVPASRARRHSITWLEYSPSRRSTAPFSPAGAASYSATTSSLYCAVNSAGGPARAPPDPGVPAHRSPVQHRRPPAHGRARSSPSRKVSPSPPSGSQWLLRGGCLTTAWQRGRPGLRARAGASHNVSTSGRSADTAGRQAAGTGSPAAGSATLQTG